MKNKTFAKLTMIVLMLSVIMTVFAVTALADGASVAITPDKQSAAPGEEVVVSVNVNALEVTSAKLKLTFDESIFEVKKRAFTDVLPSEGIMTSLGDGMFALDNSSLDLNADVFVVTLKVKDGATVGNAKISLKAMIEVDYEKLPNIEAETNVKIVCAASAHAWANATCTAPKTCSVCGMTQGEAKGHDWNNATCQTPKKCGTCGITEGEVSDHYFRSTNSDNIASQATCVDAAKYYYKCLFCDAYGENTFSKGEALGHTGGTATCTEKATCTRCNQQYGDFAHTYDQQNVNSTYLASEATCTTKATYYKSCACGAKGTETFEAGELAAHNYVEKVEDAYIKSGATCSAKAVYYVSCDKCSVKGETTFEAGELLDHTYGTEWKSDANGHWNECECGAKSATANHTWNNGEVTKEATESDFGVKTFTCTACQETKSENIPKLSPEEDKGDPTVWIIGGVVLVVAVVVICAIVFRKGSAPKTEAQTKEESEENDDTVDNKEDITEENNDDTKSN